MMNRFKDDVRRYANLNLEFDEEDRSCASDTKVVNPLTEKELMAFAERLSPTKGKQVDYDVQTNLGLVLLDKGPEGVRYGKGKAYTPTEEEKKQFSEMMAFGNAFDYLEGKGLVSCKGSIDVIQKGKIVEKYVADHPEIQNELERECGFPAS